MTLIFALLILVAGPLAGFAVARWGLRWDWPLQLLGAIVWPLIVSGYFLDKIDPLE